MDDNSYQKPPIGLLPKSLYEEQKQTERFADVCNAISSYYNDCRPIDIAWILEYKDMCGKEKERILSKRDRESKK